MEIALRVNGGGCGCKLPAARLLEIVAPLNTADERVLVGPGTADDAAVYRIDDERALVQTVDFFPPPVDDPYDFGRIAATNALSDVYAMGAQPVTALNLVAFPLEALDGGELEQILRGGADVCADNGVSVVGGHSIDADEPHYGLSVCGIAPIERILTNAGARDGDVVVLTKPLGVGAAMFGHRRGEAGDALLAEAVAVMCRSNREAAAAAVDAGAHAMTDVTGYGLLGHLHHVCRESGLGAQLDAAAVPALGDEVAGLLADESGMSGGARRNAEWAASFTRLAPSVPGWLRRLLVDPTTSGGLLVALDAERAAGIPGGAVIGRLHEGEPGVIDVT